MSAIASVTVLSGLRPEHRCMMAQVGDTVVICNGHDANQIFSVRTRTAYTLGLATPAAPTGALIAGALTGTFLYRVRWRDANTGTVSLAGASLSQAPAAQGVHITQPGSAPARATHWIIERTANNGATFYPLNQTSAAPDGTAIGTATYDDATTDATLTARFITLQTQGQPGPYRWVKSNMGRIHMGGGRVHKPTVTATNGSPTVTSADGGFVPSGFTNATSPLIGQDFQVPTDGDGRIYKIQSVTDANTLVLSTNYAATTVTAAARIAGNRDQAAFSEARLPEAYGSAAVGALSNEFRVGDNGAPLIAGEGLGAYGFLYANEDGLYLHSYSVNPTFSPIGDGKIIKLETRRGSLSPMALRFIDGYIYGIDYRGIWRMAPGSLPEEIGNPVNADFLNNVVNFGTCDNWHIGYDPTRRLIYFCVSIGEQTYPQQAYVYDLESDPGYEWTMQHTFPLGATCTTERPDACGMQRMCYYQEASGAAGSYEYMAGIGNADGAHPNNTPMSGTATGGSSSTIVDSGATFYTTGEKLKGVTVEKTSGLDGSTEIRAITDNTATTLTVAQNWNVDAAAGDTYRIGRIPGTWRTGRIYCDIPDRKKTFVVAWVYANYNPAAIALHCRAYYDGQSTPNSDIAVTQSEDGVTRTLNTAQMDIDETTAAYRFKVPLNGVVANDIQLEFYGYDAGEPWVIREVVIYYEVDKDLMQAER